MGRHRYNNRTTFRNNTEEYKTVFKERGVKHINHYDTAKLRHPTSEEILTLELTTVTWSVGDRLFKLAFEFYGDATMWWVIAWFNQKPTESDFSIGDTVSIPSPLEDVLGFMDV